MCCCAAVCAYETAPLPSACGGASDTSSISFESGTTGWYLRDHENIRFPDRIAGSTERAFAGSTSLVATLDIPVSDSWFLAVRVPSSVPLGATLTFHVWLPADSPIGSVQPFVMDAEFTWSGHWIPVENLALGCWMEIEVPVPPTFTLPLFELGVQFITPFGAAFSGDVYIDAISW